MKLRNWTAPVLITIILIFLMPNISKQVSVLAVKSNDQYLVVGGQNGTWFQPGQAPRLYQIFPSNHSLTRLVSLPNIGAVWTGCWNGSQWLISGWGAIPGVDGSNPYIYLYDGHNRIIAGTLRLWRGEGSWHGGDVFAASYDGGEWLLSGLGSDWLPSGWGSLSTGKVENHLALALFNGYNFTDLSGDVPNQWDGILFANAWNGHYWLVGGGWQGNEGVLYRYDGANFTDLSYELDSAMPQRGFHSVQTIAWNGNYWLIGGVGFLVKYDGQNFTDLTADVNMVIGGGHALEYMSCCNAVNAVAWDGASWRIGGGAAIATLEPLTAWAASYDGVNFTDLTSFIPPYIADASQGSSILTITSSNGSWFFGGYANGRGFLFSYANSAVTDYSGMMKDVTTVNWLGSSPKLAVETSPGSVRGSYLIMTVGIVAIATALVIGYKKHNRRER